MPHIKRPSSETEFARGSSSKPVEVLLCVYWTMLELKVECRCLVETDGLRGLILH